MRSIFIAASVTLGLANPCFAAGPYNPFHIGNWMGGAYTNDATGAFSHCAASVAYKNGINLLTSVTADGSWLLAFSNDRWNFNPGSSLPLSLTFDGLSPIIVTATARTPTFATVGMPTNSTLINTFRNAKTMNAFAAGNLALFKLSGTARLMPALIVCAQRQGRPAEPARVANAEPPPHKPTAPTQPAAPVNAEASAERTKLINEAAAEHSKCEQSQMRLIVPYSNESAETIAQVVLTKCDEAEQKFVSLGMALFNVSKADMKKVVDEALSKQKNNMVAEIVTFRAELAKSIAGQNAPRSKVKGKDDDRI